jgi:flap endonuclease-1
MGNAALREISSVEEVSSELFENSSVAVDAYNWLYKYMTTTAQFTDSHEYRLSDGTEIPALHGAVSGVRRFFENDITPVFVFDGGFHNFKESELEERRSSKESAKEKAKTAKKKGDVIKAARLESRSKSLNDTTINATMDFLDALDVQYLVAPKSGESQAAGMVANGEWDFVVSDDYDSLLFGSPDTLRNFTSSSRPYELLSLEKTMNMHELSREQLVDVAILCGTDYNDGVKGYGPKTSVSSVKESGDIFGVLDDEGEHIENVEELRDIFLNPTVETDFPAPSKPDPDANRLTEVLKEKWELPENVVDPAVEKIEGCSTQKGLGNWT